MLPEKTDQITDYMTRGDDIFSHLMKQLITHQEPIPEKRELPNEGKKVMVFSDSRSVPLDWPKKYRTTLTSMN